MRLFQTIRMLAVVSSITVRLIAVHFDVLFDWPSCPSAGKLSHLQIRTTSSITGHGVLDRLDSFAIQKSSFILLVDPNLPNLVGDLRGSSQQFYVSFLFFLKRTHCIDYSKNKRGQGMFLQE